MTTQNHGEKENKNLTIFRDDAPPKAGEPLGTRRELNEEEIATVTAGTMRALESSAPSPLIALHPGEKGPGRLGGSFPPGVPFLTSYVSVNGELKLSCHETPNRSVSQPNLALNP